MYYLNSNKGTSNMNDVNFYKLNEQAIRKQF